jgi:ubiquinone/menaquinone biosynthesis C-methylase UbiE
MYIILILILVVFVLTVALLWRLASRRRSIPCPVWLKWMVEMDNPLTKTNRAAVIIEHLNLKPGMVVADVGCGPGRLTIPLAEAVGREGRVVALDIQQGMLDRVREKAQAQGLGNIEYLVAGAGQDKLGKERFDRALLVTVLGEIPDREEVLKEIHTSLKPGGLLSVTEVIFDPHFQRRSTVTRLAQAAGFQEKAFHGNRFAYTLQLKK